MVSITRPAMRSRASLRHELLDAAAELLSERGYVRLRMADIACRVGVSRQTVYNEFGSKAALVQAVTLRTLSEFTEGIQQRLHSCADVLSGVHAATAYTIEHAKKNRLVAAALGTREGEDLLPLLTTRGEPVLRAASDLAEAYLRERLPQLHTADFVAETMARLTLSYLVLPTCTTSEAAAGVRAVVASLISHLYRS